MADIFEEVEEGIRQERLTRLWKRYGILAYIIGGLLIGGVWLNEYLKDSEEKAAIRTTIALEAALADVEASAFQEAGDALSELAMSDTQVAPIAGHYLARVRLDGNGDAVAAADALIAAAAGSEGPAANLALIKAAYLRADTASRAELETMLGPLIDDTSAFTALAQELIAAKALEEGDMDFARAEFNYLSIAPNVPAGVVKRASQALASLPPAIDPLVATLPAETEPEADPAPTEETVVE